MSSMVQIIKNKALKGSYGRTITADIYYKKSDKPLPILVFAHGFKGFKDWGHWHKIAETFAEVGYCFIKFNFSHNGVRPDNLLHFVDLEAFGYNNYTKELDDLQVVLDWIGEDKKLEHELNWNILDISLIGHSRGGPIVLIGALENELVKRVITWASVHELDYAWTKDETHLKLWKEKGVYYVDNSRTNQRMPLYYQLYENYTKNKGRLSVKKTLEKLNKPYLILHGSADLAVPIEAAEYLKKNALKGTLKIIKDANHTFGGTHLFEENELPIHSKKMIEYCLDFFNNNNKL